VTAPPFAKLTLRRRRGDLVPSMELRCTAATRSHRPLEARRRTPEWSRRRGTDDGAPRLIRIVSRTCAEVLGRVIAAVLFDLYETLVTERHATPVRASSLGERLGLDATAFRLAWRPQRSRVIRGQVSFAEALLEVGVRLGRRLDVEQVHGIANERRLEKAALFQGVEEVAVEVLHQLGARGVRLGIISNCFEEDVAAWPQCSVAKCFDASVFSCEVGTAKPEARIYLEATQRLGVDSSNAVFIGDGGDDELLGAERVGLRVAQAAWFRGEVAGLPGHIPRLSSWSAVLDIAEAG